MMRIAKSAFLGFLGATAMIHITLLFMPTFRNFENKYLTERHSECETATLLIVGFLALIMEPVTYRVNLAVFLEKYGLIAFIWLVPIAIIQSYACVRWAIRRKP